jgi:hypothetical protein
MDFLRWPFRAEGGTGSRRPAKRRCILHVGSPKTASSTIQSVLKSNRESLLEDGILVPRSGQTESGSHRFLAFSLAGQPVPREGTAADRKLAREIAASDADTVLISSECLWSILNRKDAAERVIGRLRSMDLDVTLLLYVRNQPQYFNSMYQHDANFRRRRGFLEFIDSGRRNMARYGFGRWLSIAETRGVPLIVRPFSEEVRKRGVVEDFLAAAGIAPANRYDLAAELRRSVGPFTVAVAQSLMRRIGAPTKLTEEQASDCRHALRAELRRRGIEDHGYCGLTSGLAAEIEQAFAKDNARFAEAVWGKPWREVFACDTGRDFEPNDYAMTGVPGDRRQLLEEVLASLGPRIEAIAKPGGNRMLSALKSRFQQ